MANREILKSYTLLDAEIRELSKSIEKEKAAVDSYIRRLDRSIELLKIQKAQIEDAIDRLPNPLHRTVLRAKYINGESVVSLAQHINYSESRTYDLIKEAEKEFKL